MPQRKKAPGVRARANVASTAASLPADGVGDAPVLPQIYESIALDNGGTFRKATEWLPETLEWWADLWSAPMSNEYHSSDRHGLFRLAALINNYWLDPCAKTHAEVRLAQKDYGLTPYDRRRLEWTIEAAEDAKDKGRRRGGGPQSSPQPEPSGDPRLKLVN